VERPLQLMEQEQPYRQHQKNYLERPLQLMGQEQPYFQDDTNDGDYQEWLPDDRGDVDLQWGQDSQRDQHQEGKRNGMGSSHNGQGWGRGKRFQTDDLHWGQDSQRDQWKPDGRGGDETNQAWRQKRIQTVLDSQLGQHS
jgi:hypothetical protein